MILMPPDLGISEIVLFHMWWRAASPPYTPPPEGPGVKGITMEKVKTLRLKANPNLTTRQFVIIQP